MLQSQEKCNTEVDGGPRGAGQDGGGDVSGHEEQGAMWTGSVRILQSKCWSETGERLVSIVVYRWGGTGKQIGTKDILRKLLYADGLAVVADGEADLQEELIE